MNIEYMVKIGSHPAAIYYTFDRDSKMIRGVRVVGSLDLHQVQWILSHAPNDENDLVNNMQRRIGKKVMIKFVPQDLRFEVFWERFNNKIGKKKRAEHLWNLLSDVDRQQALVYIEVYHSYLRQNPTITKLYPETYLSQERWKN